MLGICLLLEIKTGVSSSKQHEEQNCHRPHRGGGDVHTNPNLCNASQHPLP
jgi:hypothetical protein